MCYICSLPAKYLFKRISINQSLYINCLINRIHINLFCCTLCMIVLEICTGCMNKHSNNNNSLSTQLPLRLLMHKVCVSQAPAYTSDIVTACSSVPERVTDFAHLPFAITSYREKFENSARERFQYLAFCCGMHCQTILNQQTQPIFSTDF